MVFVRNHTMWETTDVQSIYGLDLWTWKPSNSWLVRWKGSPENWRKATTSSDHNFQSLHINFWSASSSILSFFCLRRTVPPPFWRLTSSFPISVRTHPANYHPCQNLSFFLFHWLLPVSLHMWQRRWSGYLLCARYMVIYLPYLGWSSHQPSEVGDILSIYRWGNWGFKEFSDIHSQAQAIAKWWN